MLPWNPTSITCVLYVTVGHIARRSCYGLGTLAAPKKRWTPIFEPAKHSHSWLKKVQWLFFSSNFSKRSYWKKPYFWRSTSSLSYLPFFLSKKFLSLSWRTWSRKRSKVAFGIPTRNWDSNREMNRPTDFRYVVACFRLHANVDGRRCNHVGCIYIYI